MINHKKKLYFMIPTYRHDSGFAQTAVFISQVLMHPRQLGAIAPSSERLTTLMIESACLDTANTVVEFGPGTGAFTKCIVDALPPSGKYTGIEQNSQFAYLLERRFASSTIVALRPPRSAPVRTAAFDRDQVAKYT